MRDANYANAKKQHGSVANVLWVTGDLIKKHLYYSVKYPTEIMQGRQNTEMFFPGLQTRSVGVLL